MRETTAELLNHYYCIGTTMKKVTVMKKVLLWCYYKKQQPKDKTANEEMEAWLQLDDAIWTRDM